MAIPVIDIFAGPGGLGEGFSAFLGEDYNRQFEIVLSIEKDSEAHKTLTLRSFFRQFPIGNVPEEYYSFIRGEITVNQLYEKYPIESEIAKNEAWQATLGEISNDEVDERISSAINGVSDWLLIGGPPCQAYSVVGRSRRKEKILNAAKDHRVELYKQYLRILAVHNPAVFVMENVKGILSAQTDESPIFSKILKDLSDPIEACSKEGKLTETDLQCPGYKIYSLVNQPKGFDLNGNPEFNHRDFTIYAENHGIPQTRHRVILLGIRRDIEIIPEILNQVDQVPLLSVLHDLPKLRSGLSRTKKEDDTNEEWLKVIKSINLQHSELHGNAEVLESILNHLENLVPFKFGTGKDFISWPDTSNQYGEGWFHDPKLLGILNHSSRGHMKEDLHRYFFASVFGAINGVSPRIIDFPEKLYPLHKNINQAVSEKKFADRFRVQIANRPSKTITSHISKDGHYYIHPDASQCRSLTVREAARIQTFPDNYFFCGSRTSQYIQVGNAVPPFLAFQIAKVVSGVFNTSNQKQNMIGKYEWQYN